MPACRRIGKTLSPYGQEIAALGRALGVLDTLQMPIEAGVAAGHGFKHASRSIIFPGAPTGALENVLVSVSADEAYADFAEILLRRSLDSAASGSAASSSTNLFDIIDTNTSSEDVFQGSSNRS